MSNKQHLFSTRCIRTSLNCQNEQTKSAIETFMTTSEVDVVLQDSKKPTCAASPYSRVVMKDASKHDQTRTNESFEMIETPIMRRLCVQQQSPPDTSHTVCKPFAHATDLSTDVNHCFDAILQYHKDEPPKESGPCRSIFWHLVTQSKMRASHESMKTSPAMWLNATQGGAQSKERCTSFHFVDMHHTSESGGHTHCDCIESTNVCYITPKSPTCTQKRPLTKDCSSSSSSNNPYAFFMNNHTEEVNFVNIADTENAMPCSSDRSPISRLSSSSLMLEMDDSNDTISDDDSSASDTNRHNSKANNSNDVEGHVDVHSGRENNNSTHLYAMTCTEPAHDRPDEPSPQRVNHRHQQAVAPLSTALPTTNVTRPETCTSAPEMHHAVRNAVDQETVDLARPERRRTIYVNSPNVSSKSMMTPVSVAMEPRIIRSNNIICTTVRRRRSCQNRNMINDYQVVRELGHGSYAKVVLVKDVRDEKLYAMKVLIGVDRAALHCGDALRKREANTRTNASAAVAADAMSCVDSSGNPASGIGRPQERRRLAAEREIDIARRVQGTHIVQTYEIITSSSRSGMGRIYLLLQYMQGGSIARRKPDGQLIAVPEWTLRRQAHQILCALRYLQCHGIIHRDIKPDNILLDADGNAYLSDFGHSASYNSQGEIAGVEGTPAYMAPELCRCDRLVQGSAVDVWSLGVTLYELMYAVHPFVGQTCSTYRTNIVHQPLVFPDEGEICTSVTHAEEIHGAPRTAGGAIHSMHMEQQAMDRAFAHECGTEVSARRGELESMTSYGSVSTNTDVMNHVDAEVNKEGAFTTTARACCTSELEYCAPTVARTTKGLSSNAKSSWGTNAAVCSVIRSSPEFKQLIRGMLERNSKERWTVHRALACEWFRLLRAPEGSTNCSGPNNPNMWCIGHTYRHDNSEEQHMCY